VAYFWIFCHKKQENGVAPGRPAMNRRAKVIKAG